MSRASNPRLYGLGDDFGDAPTYDGSYETGEGGIGTHPFPPAGATLPRGAVISRPPGLGGPKKPDETKQRNVPLIAGIIGGAVVLLVICVVLVLALGPLLNQGPNTGAATKPPAPTTQPTATTSNTTPTADTSRHCRRHDTGAQRCRRYAEQSEVGAFEYQPQPAQEQGLQSDPIAKSEPGQPPDIVLSTVPSAGTQVPAGSTVTIYYEPAATATATSIATATASGTASATATLASGTALQQLRHKLLGLAYPRLAVS